ncbi:hypothetical protein [Frankia sp. Cr1]|uniref:hypothetical protein n=1 Tax=Frankia sp. Cr1 TaxID=3073931 RepID=UPI002AD5974C|nr:hypothetical protein [Frankia sp. Cr1]
MTTPVFTHAWGQKANELSVEPALASWDRAGLPGQARSAVFIGGVCAAVAGQARTTHDPLALRLNIGLPDTVPPYAPDDLANYTIPRSRRS